MTPLARQRALVRRADLDGLACDRAVASVWQALLAVLRDPRGHGHTYRRALAVLRSLPALVTSTMRQRLAQTYRLGHRAAVLAVAPRLRRRVREDAASDLADILMPPPPAETVLGFLDRFIRPADWQAIGTPSDRRMPEELARQLADGVSRGLTQYELAKELRPFLEGSRVRARRAARTFGLHAANAAQLDAWEGLGDMVDGYTVHATLDQYTRPAHRARDGTRYYLHPRPGQKGLGDMPRPPLEADGSIAWNCRCFLTPILGVE